MKIPPFTIQEAQDIAVSFQYLVGKEYVDGVTKQVYKILTVGILPFFPYDKCMTTHMYTGLMHKADGFSLDAILDYLDAGDFREFDVVLTARPTENDQTQLVIQPIDTIVTNHGLEYTFGIAAL